jgi:hypothetical protein
MVAAFFYVIDPSWDLPCLADPYQMISLILRARK